MEGIACSVALARLLCHLLLLALSPSLACSVALFHLIAFYHSPICLTHSLSLSTSLFLAHLNDFSRYSIPHTHHVCRPSFLVNELLRGVRQLFWFHDLY